MHYYTSVFSYMLSDVIVNYYFYDLKNNILNKTCICK